MLLYTLIFIILIFTELLIYERYKAKGLESIELLCRKFAHSIVEAFSTVKN